MFVSGYNDGYNACSHGGGPSAGHNGEGCYDSIDAGPNWLAGYYAGWGTAVGSSAGHPNNAATQSADFQSGFDQGYSDGQKGAYGPFC